MLVIAPRFEGATECRTDMERRFLERLNERATSGGWSGDSWSHLSDHVIIGVCLFLHKSVHRTLRIDFFGAKVLAGDDETHQFVTDLDLKNPSVAACSDGAPETMADWAADWIEFEMAKSLPGST